MCECGNIESVESTFGCGRGGSWRSVFESPMHVVRPCAITVRDCCCCLYDAASAPLRIEHQLDRHAADERTRSYATE